MFSLLLLPIVIIQSMLRGRGYRRIVGWGLIMGHDEGRSAKVCVFNGGMLLNDLENWG